MLSEVGGASRVNFVIAGVKISVFCSWQKHRCKQAGFGGFQEIDQAGHMRLPDRWQSDAASGMLSRIDACKIFVGASKRLVTASFANPVWFVS